MTIRTNRLLDAWALRRALPQRVGGVPPSVAAVLRRSGVRVTVCAGAAPPCELWPRPSLVLRLASAVSRLVRSRS